MTQVGVAVCPDCKQGLKVPAAWADRPVRCKHCGAAFMLKTRGRPAASTASASQSFLTWKSSLAGGLALASVVFLVAFSWPHLSQSVAKPAVTEVGKTPPVAPSKNAATETGQPLVKTQEAKPLSAAPEKKAEKKAAPVKKQIAPLPKPAGRLTASELARYIDKAIQHRLDVEGVPTSPLADDAEFIRRAYLDITGVIPPADKVAAFLDSKEPNKCARVIDELLASPLYGRHMADIWQALMLTRSSDNRRLQVEPLGKWFQENFNRNKPWNQMVYDFVTATGTQEENGAATFYMSNAGPDKVTDKITQMFLGVKLQCAQCHNHPFTSWKQTEYWGMAAFFTKINLGGNVKGAAKKGVTLTVSEKVIKAKGGKKAKGFKLPQGAKVVAAKFLGGEEPKLNPSAPYRPILAKWLAAPQNPFVARAMSNRMWGHFFGRGFTTPVDDMHDQNPNSNPELLGVVAEQFAGNDFDLKYLVRALCNSQTYQRTSKPVPGNEDDDVLFSHMAIKALSPEQLYDSLELVAGGQDAAPGGKNQQAKKKGQAKKNTKKPVVVQKKKKGGAVTLRTGFVNFFNVDEGADPTEYQAGIPQALRLMNSRQLNNDNALLTRVMGGPGTSPVKVVEQLYLTTLARRPLAAESQKLATYVQQQTNARKAYQDVLWALLNSSEFALNH